MWIFVDDSGDCGFKFDDGSSQFLVIAACVFKTREDIAHAIELVDEARNVRTPTGETFRLNREFKHSKSKDAHKDRFFEAVSPARFRIRAITVDKRQIYSSKLRERPNDMKSFLIRQMLTHTLGTVRDAKLIVDGRDTRAFGMTDRDYFMRVVNREAPGTLAEVEYADSAKSNLIQLADMVAGSLRRSRERDEAAAAHVATYRRRFGYPSGSDWIFR